ncbi:MAG TPA: metallophosphoesterase [Methanoregulaceae archaeon]|nr:metallophosphoesterase [Methanoregulaceae archaeon]
MAWEAGNPTITPLHIRGAPDGIVFIADPHIKNENKETVREVIRMINEMQPSIVLIGGDFTGQGEETLSFQEIWKGIDAPVYAVLGNHDYKVGIQGSGAEGRMAWVIESILRSQGYNTSPLYSDPDIASADILEDVLERNGVTVLRNEWISLDMNGQRLILCGLDDIWAGKADPPDLPDNGAYRIYLLHEPYYQEEWDADLILSGHTHGGQIGNGIFMVLDTAGIVDIRGRSMKDDTIMYVTRGIGTSKGDNDYRLFSSPEIVVIN